MCLLVLDRLNGVIFLRIYRLLSYCRCFLDKKRCNQLTLLAETGLTPLKYFQQGRCRGVGEKKNFENFLLLKKEIIGLKHHCKGGYLYIFWSTFNNKFFEPRFSQQNLVTTPHQSWTFSSAAILIFRSNILNTTSSI